MRLVVLLILGTFAWAEDPVLNHDTFAAWRGLIVPSAEERQDEQIDWAPTLGDGLQRAAKEQKPLFLWMMNGHPLGNT